MPASSGNANCAHEEVVKGMFYHFARLPHAPQVTFVATDGDCGYSQLYLARFEG
jgi:hypothetical protein